MQCRFWNLSVKGLLINRCSIQPLNLASLQGTSSLQDAVRMQQGLPWKHGTVLETQQLTRLTLSTEDSSAAAQAFTGTHAAASSYDLLAVQPMSERVLQQVQDTCLMPSIVRCAARRCTLTRQTHRYSSHTAAVHAKYEVMGVHANTWLTSGMHQNVLQACTSLEVDIIAFDLAKRLPFRLKPGPLQSALRRGLFFEVKQGTLHDGTNHARRLHGIPLPTCLLEAGCIAIL